MREKLIELIKEVSSYLGVHYIILFDILIISMALFYLARLRKWKTMEESDRTFSIIMISASVLALIILH